MCDTSHMAKEIYEVVEEAFPPTLGAMFLATTGPVGIALAVVGESLVIKNVVQDIKAIQEEKNQEASLAQKA